MVRWSFIPFIVILLMAGCASTGGTVEDEGGDTAVEEQKTIDLAPSDREVLLRKARDYQRNRDYANALISIVRAERAGGHTADGDTAVDGEIRRLKNELIENLNARAIDETVTVEPGKGLDVPLEYMVFYTEGEVIYPAFNIPVFFEVTDGVAQITGESYTNTNGVAECEVIRVDALEDDRILITASVFLDIEGETFTVHKLDRHFTLRRQSMRELAISFVVYESNIDRVVPNSTAGKRIEQFFIENGFSVSRGILENDEALFMRAASGDVAALQVYGEKLTSSLIAFTYIESVFSSRVSEGFYFARSRILLDVVDVSTNRVVFNAVVEDVKGAGNTEEKAGKMAIAEATDQFIDTLRVEIEAIGFAR